MSRARPEGSELLQATAAGVPTRAINMLVFLGEQRTARLDSRFKQAQAGQLYSQIVTEACKYTVHRKEKESAGAERSPLGLARRGTISASGPLLNLFATEEDLKDVVLLVLTTYPTR